MMPSQPAPGAFMVPVLHETLVCLELPRYGGAITGTGLFENMSIGNRAAQIQTTFRLICLLIIFSLYSIFAPKWSLLGALSLPDQ